MVCINGRIVHIRQHQRKLHTGVPVLRWSILPRMFEVKRSEFGLISVGEKEDAPILESDPMPAQSHRAVEPNPGKEISGTHHGESPHRKMGPCDLRSIFRQSDKRHVSWTSSRVSRSEFLGRTFAIIAASVSIVLISDHSIQTSKQGVYCSRAISIRCHVLSSSPFKPPSCLWFRERKK